MHDAEKLVGKYRKGLLLRDSISNSVVVFFRERKLARLRSTSVATMKDAELL